LGINGIYVPLKVAEGNLKDAVNGLKANGFVGFNITIPYKEAILDYVDEISEEVQLLGTAIQ
jgi:shikimate dehydrogenase